MFRILICAAVIGICGCGLKLSIWSAGPGSSGCPDADYDNGGQMVFVPGMCKSGTGALIFYEGKL